MEYNWNSNIYLNFRLIAYFILRLGIFFMERRNENFKKYFYKNISNLL